MTLSGCTTQTSVAYYYFWIEEFPRESMQEITNLTPHPGESVSVSAAWSSGSATFQLCDWTQNVCLDGNQTSPGPDNVSEWIVERPTNELTGLEHLANYNYVAISGSYYTAGGKSYSIAQSPRGNHQIQMTGSGGKVISSVSSLASSGAGFNAYWKGFN